MQTVDLRRQLPRANWTNPARGHAPSSITLHYNGPAVPDERRRGDGAIQQLRIDAEWHMRPGALSPGGADGIQYHYAVDAAGVAYQCRDVDTTLWHCGHATGNRDSIAVHLILGGTQPATEAQWAATVKLCQSLMQQHGIEDKADVVPHQFWTSTNCPGTDVLRRLHQWHAEPLVKTFVYIRAEAVQRTPVRQEPHDGGTVAGQMQAGEWGEFAIGSNGDYSHRVDGLGFVKTAHLRVVEDSPIEDTFIAAPSVPPERLIAFVTAHDNGAYTEGEVAHIIKHYDGVCRAVGLDGAWVVAQLCHETGYLSSTWAARPRRNPAGIGVTGEPGAGLSFPSWRHSTAAHVGRLLLYALRDDEVGTHYERWLYMHTANNLRPLPDHLRGIGATASTLTGTWAADPAYGDKLQAMYRRIVGGE